MRFACSLLLVTASASQAQLTESFEGFDVGPLDDQFGWSAESDDTAIASTGLAGFGDRTLVHTVNPGEPFFDIRSPQFTTPYGEGLFLDVRLDNDLNALAIKPWDVGGGIQNTILSFERDGSMTAFQLSEAGTFTGVTHPTAGGWQPGRTTRIGFVVYDDQDLEIYQDGDIIFLGRDMAQAYPFGGADSGISQLRIEKGVDFVGGATAIFIDNISDGSTTVSVPDVALSMPFDAVPNPFRSSVVVSSESLGDIVRVYSPTGRLVRALSAGAGPVVWDGTSNDGRAVAPGVYFVRGIAADGREIAGRVTRVR